MIVQDDSERAGPCNNDQGDEVGSSRPRLGEAIKSASHIRRLKSRMCV